MIILVAAALQDGAEVLTNRAQAECAYAELSADGVLVSATQLAAAVQPSLAIGLAQSAAISARTALTVVRAASPGHLTPSGLVKPSGLAPGQALAPSRPAATPQCPTPIPRCRRLLCPPGMARTVGPDAGPTKVAAGRWRHAEPSWTGSMCGPARTSSFTCDADRQPGHCGE
jgi:hypothetical protein